MSSDNFSNPDYDCMVKIIEKEVVAVKTWYDDYMKNWIIYYLFEVCKIFFGNIEAYLFKYFDKYFI